MTTSRTNRGELRVKSAGDNDIVVVELAGAWIIGSRLPSTALLTEKLKAHSNARRLAFDSGPLEAWDSALLTFLIGVLDYAQRNHLAIDQSGLPEGAQRLLKLAYAVPERQGVRRGQSQESFLSRVGLQATATLESSQALLGFVGEASAAALRMIRGQARLRRSDLTWNIEQSGVRALGIVSLISFLVGLILAFVGAVQLRQFGAQIYVADLVGLGMVREMGAMMAGIIMAGRTGAAFAAQLGTMRVNEEIDALTTMGISPMEFLVLPRMVALALMMPLLCLYADLLGILGGAFVGIGTLDLEPILYFEQTRAAITLPDVMAGLVKSAVFGVLVAIAGCFRGMQCGNSASAVGVATTSAVVTGIVFIIVSDALLTVVYDAIGV